MISSSSPKFPLDWSLLPPEIAVQVLSNSGYKAVINSSMVCRAWACIQKDVEQAFLPHSLGKIFHINEICYVAILHILNRTSRTQDGYIYSLCKRATYLAPTSPAEVNKLPHSVQFIIYLGSTLNGQFDESPKLKQVKIPHPIAAKADESNGFALFIKSLSIGNPIWESDEGILERAKQWMFPVDKLEIFQSTIFKSYKEKHFPIEGGFLLAHIAECGTTLKRAADKGSLLAAYCYSGQEETPIDERAFYLKLAAVGGLPVAQYQLADSLHRDGSQSEKIIQLIGEAALHKIPAAQFLLGELIANKHLKAYRYLSRMKQEDMDTVHVEHGEKLYASGSLEVNSYRTALTQELAFQCLSRLYSLGIGVKRDEDLAKFYLSQYSSST